MTTEPPEQPQQPERYDYPLRFDVDYPDRPLNRLTTLLRIFWIIPIFIVYASLSGLAFTESYTAAGEGATRWSLGGSGFLFLPVLLMILFRKKYPRWWFDFNVAVTRFAARISSYFLLLRDEYPSTDEEQAVHLEVDYPNAQELNRFLPLIKWLLLLPHYLVLFFLFFGVLFAVIVAWFAILFTGRYPAGLFDFVVGALRWSYRVLAYGFLLTTDKYPPFALR